MIVTKNAIFHDTVYQSIRVDTIALSLQLKEEKDIYIYISTIKLHIIKESTLSKYLKIIIQVQYKNIKNSTGWWTDGQTLFPF